MSTIAAISTAQGVGGIGVVRISGPESIKIADKLFVPFIGDAKLESLKGYTAKYGKVSDSEEFIDEAIALIFRAPHSYTGEDVVELSCHGGLYLTRRLLRAVLDAGASLAEAGEFTKRAFLNGKMNLAQAEAVMDLISAKNQQANQLAFSAKEGRISKKTDEIKTELIDIVANLSVWADYPEEDIPQVDENTLKISLENIESKLTDMIKNYDVCKAIKEGVKTAIIGKPNVGKSTLMNLLAGQQKSIVTDIPGTTRDVIEETVMLGDIPLLLVDTAGIRETSDVIEKIGVEKAKEHINASDVVLLIIDASAPLGTQDTELLQLVPKNKTIVLLNKIDLGKKVDLKEVSTFLKNIVELSAANGTGIEKLKELLYDMIGLTNLDPSAAVVSSERQLDLLKKVLNVIRHAEKELQAGMTLDALTVLLQEAVQFFLEFTGERASEAVIDRVFSKFCVGK